MTRIARILNNLACAARHLGRAILTALFIR
jgi:hypothetical protein